MVTIDDVVSEGVVVCSDKLKHPAPFRPGTWVWITAVCKKVGGRNDLPFLE